jgi:hypothetical protein
MPQINKEKRFVRFYLPLPWGSRPEAKIGGLTVPMAAGRLILQGAERIQLKSGVGIPEMNKKDEPRTDIKFLCGPRPQIRRFSHRRNEHFKNGSF